jgi:hypothetical protein
VLPSALALVAAASAAWPHMGARRQALAKSWLRRTVFWFTFVSPPSRRADD